VGAALTICCVWEVLMSWQVTASMTGGGEPLAQPPLGVRVLAGPPLPGRQPVRVQVIRDQVRAGPLHVRGVGPESFGDLLQLGGQLRLSRALPEPALPVLGEHRTPWLPAGLGRVDEYPEVQLDHRAVGLPDGVAGLPAHPGASRRAAWPGPPGRAP